MKPTSNFNLARLVSALHPPLPRTERQSKQLLDVLTTSFRSQLDAAHPPVEQRHDEGTRRPRSNSSSHERSKSPAPVSTRVTETHLKDILNHPLFSGPTNTASHPAMYSVPGVASDLQELKQDPLAVFVGDAARGLVTRNRFVDCFEVLKANILKESKAKVAQDSSLNLSTVYAEQLAKSGGAAHVISYIGSLDTKTMVHFMSWPRLVKAFMPFLVAVQKEVFVGELLKSLYGMVDSEETPLSHVANAQYALIGSLLQSETGCGRGLETAILHYAKIGHFYDHVRNSASQRSTALHSCGRWLLKKMISQARVGSADTNNKLSVDAIEMFLHFRHHWCRGEREHDFWDSALPLYHPTQPNATPYLAFLQSKNITGKEDWAQEKYRKTVLRASLDAARILVDQRSFRAAGTVMEYVKRNFATDLELEKLERISVPESREVDETSSYQDLVHELEMELELKFA